MPRTGHRLDLVLAPAADAPLHPNWEAPLKALTERGFLRQEAPGPRAAELVGGGFARARQEIGVRDRFYGNLQGGLRASCPHCQHNLVPGLIRALAVLRDGRGARPLRCPGCRTLSDLDALRYRPPAMLSTHALLLCDAGSARLREAAQTELLELLGPIRVVARRPSA